MPPLCRWVRVALLSRVGKLMACGRGARHTRGRARAAMCTSERLQPPAAGGDDARARARARARAAFLEEVAGARVTKEEVALRAVEFEYLALVAAPRPTQTQTYGTREHATGTSSEHAGSGRIPIDREPSAVFCIYVIEARQ